MFSKRTNAAEPRELARSLVETIKLVPGRRQAGIEVRGELAAILRMTGGAKQAKSAGGDADALAVQISLVAGARNHLDLLLTG